MSRRELGVSVYYCVKRLCQGEDLMRSGVAGEGESLEHMICQFQNKNRFNCIEEE
jgi:hypothetical protein